MAGTLLFSASWADEPVPGQRVVEQNCMSCHLSGAGNAPRPRHSEDWAPLLETWGFDQVVTQAWEGRGRMPARGFCQSCSREDIEAAVRYMIPEHLLDEYAPEP
ncbi:c-type cytochrome [Natronospirillum operosum]|nr:c-type cytochrome [Natronospirillum operosum]